MVWVALNDAHSAIDESRPQQVKYICPLGHYIVLYCSTVFMDVKVHS